MITSVQEFVKYFEGVRRRTLAEHEVHHRSQLDSYLSEAGVEPPQLYGYRMEEVLARQERGLPMSDCAFCKIRDGQIPSFKIHEDERTLTFMDINPLNSGHCLVVTKTHAATLFEADLEDLKAVIATAKKVALVLQHALKPDGLNMLQANGPAAFQSVPHFHLHLIPRWTHDGKGFDWKLVPGNRDQIMKTGERLRALLK